MLYLEPYFLDRNALLALSDYGSFGPSVRDLYSIKILGTENSRWKLLEYSSHSTMMQLTIQLFCKFSMVLDIFKSIDNDVIKIPQEIGNTLVDLVT